MSEPSAISVLIVEDHAVVREGLCALINAWPGVQVVGEAGDGVEAVTRARQLRPDVIVMDLAMPRMDGVQAISAIMHENPDARILVLTSFSEDYKVVRAISAGAIGYLLKDSTSDQLVSAILRVHEGRLSLCHPIARKLVHGLGPGARFGSDELDQLTPREIEIMQLVARGYTNLKIAEELSISERTVAKHVSNLLEKLEVENRTQLALFALREGIAVLSDSE